MLTIVVQSWQIQLRRRIIMSLADELFINMCSDIIENGYSTEGEKVRPKWEDGSYAYTIKKFGVVNRYDLSKEFPAITLRKTYIKSAIDELLWIWQKKSNNVHDLKSHIWDSWADENGSIGKAYGYQLGVKHQYKEGMMDQVDRLLYDLKNNPYSRRMMTSAAAEKVELGSIGVISACGHSWCNSCCVAADTAFLCTRISVGSKRNSCVRSAVRWSSSTNWPTQNLPIAARQNPPPRPPVLTMHKPTRTASVCPLRTIFLPISSPAGMSSCWRDCSTTQQSTRWSFW